ncbi:tetratricopeptide repeat protein [Candidatus Cyanaurora vandensis]|uniref:tetratricopeptide repeat protein n=1 Tax=Candidatus Cyanaurora vandensis TaxID=2714958 RepID=UPI002580B8FE|nr:tetratricopeptide repeat protein [Candidatus Cyanaurora vandensis]
MRYWSWFLALAVVVSPTVAAQTTPPTPPPNDLKVANQAYRAGDYPRAISLADKVLQSDSQNIKALLLRAAARYKAKNFDGSVADYTTVISIDKESTKAYGGRGVVYAEKGELARAEADFTKVIDIDKEKNEVTPGAFFQRAVARQRLGKVDEAIGDWSAVVILNPTDPSAYLDRALLLFFRNKYSLALADWQKASELNSKSAEALAGQAIALYRIGQKDEADVSVKAAVILEPRYGSDIAWVGSFTNQAPGWNRAAVEALKEVLAARQP